MAEVAGRIALALLALVVCVGMAVELRAHDLLENAGHVAAGAHPKPGDVDRALRDAKKVSDLRPGSQGLMAAAALDLRTARYRAATQAAQAATRREPDNFSTWVTLAVAAAGAGNTTGSQLAYAKAHLLNPLYPIPRRR